MIEKSVAAGDLRNEIVIEAIDSVPERNEDGSEGRAGDQWQPFVQARAKIDTQGGREFFQAKQINAQLTHEITIRWQQGITSKMRVRFEDPVEGTTRYFDIASPPVNPNNGIRWILLLHCRELVGREVKS